jgi:hypothetical protein
VCVTSALVGCGCAVTLGIKGDAVAARMQRSGVGKETSLPFAGAYASAVLQGVVS